MNVKNSYQMRRSVMRWLLVIFSAKFAVIVFLGLLAVQYVNYGVLIDGRYWVPKPGFKSHLDFVSDYVVWRHGWLFVVAWIIDRLTWPLLFRSELE